MLWWITSWWSNYYIITYIPSISTCNLYLIRSTGCKTYKPSPYTSWFNCIYWYLPCNS